MRTRHKKNGSTLVEVLVSFAILTSVGVFTVGFLYRNSTTNKAWLDNYGQELSKIVLLTTPIANDTITTHTDDRGFSWETIITVTKDTEESCYSAISIRNKSDTTRTLHYCTYGVAK